MLTGTNVVSCDRKLRSGRVLGIRPATLAGLMGWVAEKHWGLVLGIQFGHRSRLRGVDVELVLQDAQIVTQRRTRGSPGQWRLHRCTGCMSCWSHVRGRPCAYIVSDVVRTLIGPSIIGANFRYISSYPAPHRVMVYCSDSFPRSLYPLAII